MPDSSHSIPVIDAHHHLWDMESNPYPELLNPRDDTHLGDYRAICKNYLVKDFKADLLGLNVIKSVHIEAGWAAEDWQSETRWVQKISNQGTYPHAIVANLDLLSNDVEHRLSVLTAYPNVRGVRFRFLSPSDLAKAPIKNLPNPLENSKWCNNFKLLEAYNLSFDLQAPPQLMQMATDIAATFPGIQFVLTHAGLPLDRSDEGFTYWRQGMRSLASLDNVYVKISGLGMTEWKWTEDSLRPLILETINLFAPQKCMFGSNFPVDSLYATYERLLTSIRKIIAEHSLDEQQRILNGTASTFYRI
jgi:predicted TIM-barrel fold metal-dependent hydrolase